MDIKKIESLIKYTFKDKDLLQRVFTHSSKEKCTQKNYQSLEFLGDAILDFIIADNLMKEYPKSNEGDLTKMRSSIVSKYPLADAVEKLGLIEFLQVGKGESLSQITEHKKIKSDLFESIVAGIYRDSNDIKEVEKFILLTLDHYIKNSQKITQRIDYKSLLNEYAFKNNLEIEYKNENVAGMPHEPIFYYALFINGEKYATAEGSKKQEAEQKCAEQAAKKLGI